MDAVELGYSRGLGDVRQVTASAAPSSRESAIEKVTVHFENYRSEEICSSGRLAVEPSSLAADVGDIGTLAASL